MRTTRRPRQVTRIATRRRSPRVWRQAGADRVRDHPGQRHRPGGRGRRGAEPRARRGAREGDRHGITLPGRIAARSRPRPPLPGREPLRDRNRRRAARSGGSGGRRQDASPATRPRPAARRGRGSSSRSRPRRAATGSSPTGSAPTTAAPGASPGVPTYCTADEQAAPVLRPAATRTVVAPWRRDLTVDTPGWEPGFYVFKLRTGQGCETQVPYVVSSPSAAGTVALVAPVTTWQAYNEWGGYSLYHGPDGDRRSYAVSFDRPYNGATGRQRLPHRGLPIVVRAEQLGIPLSYFTNVDLHTPGLAGRAPGLCLDGPRRVLDDDHARGRHRGPRRRHQPRVPRRQHDVLAGAARGPRTDRPGGGRATGTTPPSTRCATSGPREATARFRDAPDAGPGARR